MGLEPCIWPSTEVSEACMTALSELDASTAAGGLDVVVGRELGGGEIGAAGAGAGVDTE